MKLLLLLSLLPCASSVLQEGFSYTTETDHNEYAREQSIRNYPEQRTNDERMVMNYYRALKYFDSLKKAKSKRDQSKNDFQDVQSKTVQSSNGNVVLDSTAGLAVALSPKSKDSSLISFGNKVVKRQFSRNQGTNRFVKASLATFRETVIRTLLYNGIPKAHLVGIATSIATNIILKLIMPQGRKPSLWEQIEDEVKNMVHEKLDDNNIAQLRDDWDIIGETLQNSKRSLTAAKINRVLTLSSNFMPHNYRTTQWSVKWPMTMMGYLASLKAMYIDLSAKPDGGIEGCEWVNMWKRYRKEVLEAGKHLARARWEKLEGTDWHGGTTELDPIAEYSYKDGATGTNYAEIRVDLVKSKVFEKIKDEIAHYLFKHLGKRFNALNTVVQKASFDFSLKKEGSRCIGTNDETSWRGKVKSAAVCAAFCESTSRYFAFGKLDEPFNRKCSAESGLQMCDCYCEENLNCTTKDDGDFDVYEFKVSTKPRNTGKDGDEVSMKLKGNGYCKSGYYAGWDNKGTANQDACNLLCLSERQCTFAAYFNDGQSQTCSRYKEKSCILDTSDDFKRAHTTYYKELSSQDNDDTDDDLFCTTKGQPCVFPFLWKGVEYTQCTKTDTSGGYQWCSTLNTRDGEMREWGECSESKNCVDKCVRGRNLTVEEFKWIFPQKCFGTCKTFEARGKRNLAHWLGLENGYWKYEKKNDCTLPCMSYSGSESAKECLINGGEKNPHLAFAIGHNECEGCKKAKWSECWPTNPPGKMFTSKHGTNPYY